MRGVASFFTVVTSKRRPILTTDLGRQCLRESIDETRQTQPFEIFAFVLLPDHLHAIWKMPRDDVDYSTRWRAIKSGFTKSWRKRGGAVFQRSDSEIKRGEHSIWQRRFFEHTIRDEEDLKRCCDYIHINPIKHGRVDRVQDWKWSSFHRFVREGEYPIDWGNDDAWYGDEFSHFE